MFRWLLAPLCLPLILIGSQAAAQPAQTGQATEPSSVPAAPKYETTVTALGLPRPLPDVPATVTVIPREQLERVPGLSMDELVRLSPTASTFRRTPALLADPTAQGPSLRAVGPSGVSRALVLVDGVPANEAFGGWVYWRALPRLGLERIEIVPGGSSALYGNYGLGGVIELVSRAHDNAAEVDLSGGTLGTAAGAARLAGRRGPVGGSVEVDGLRSSGYVPVAPAQRGAIDKAGASQHLGLRTRGEVRLGKGIRLGGRGGVFVEDQNGGTRYTTASVRSGSWALEAEHEGSGSLRAVVFGGVDRFGQERARIAPGRSTETLSAEQRVPSHTLGARLQYSTSPLQLLGAHQLLVGADARQVVGKSTESLNPAMPAAGALVEREAGGEQRFAGLFLADLFAPARYLELSAALRADVWQNLDGRRRLARMDGSDMETRFDDTSGSALSSRVGVLLRPSENSRLRASGYRAFRAPTLNELYRPFQVGTTLTDANEGLRPETLWGAELGAEGLVGAAGSVRATAFWNRLRDPIANVTLPAPLASGAGRQRQNLGSVESRGLELTADGRLSPRLDLGAAYTLARARVTSAPVQPDLVGKDVPQAPQHRARLALGFRWPERFEATLQLRFEGRSFEDDQNQLPMPNYAVVDLYAGAPIGQRLTVFGSVQNLLDRRYLVGRAGVDTVGPPLLALVGVRLR